MKHMPVDINGFSHIEYLIVFNTIIFGLVASEFFTGWGSMLRYRDNVKPYWLHFVWTIFAFFLIIQNWYGIWPRTRFIDDNMGYFIYSLVPMFIYHLIGVTLFPSFRRQKIVDLKTYFYKQARVLFILFAIYFLFTIISSFVYQDVGNVFRQNVLRGIGLFFSLLAAKYYRNLWLHFILLFMGFSGLIAFILAIPK